MKEGKYYGILMEKDWKKLRNSRIFKEEKIKVILFEAKERLLHMREYKSPVLFSRLFGILFATKLIPGFIKFGRDYERKLLFQPEFLN